MNPRNLTGCRGSLSRALHFHVGGGRVRRLISGVSRGQPFAHTCNMCFRNVQPRAWTLAHTVLTRPRILDAITMFLFPARVLPRAGLGQRFLQAELPARVTKTCARLRRQILLRSQSRTDPLLTPQPPIVWGIASADRTGPAASTRRRRGG